MIEHKCDQGSDEWRNLHLGIPSAGSFDKIITPAKGQLSASHRTYLYQLVAEALTLEPTISFDKSQWMDRGAELEPEAVGDYEIQNSCRTRKVGFITTDDGQCGASPDRFVVDAAGNIIGGLECKCPAPHTQIDYWENGFGTDYKVQVQGQNYVGDLEWTDKWSYHPAFPRVLVRCYRDEPFIALMAAALREFNDKRLALIEKLKATGMFESKKKAKTPVEQAYDGDSMPDWMSLDPDELAERIRAEPAQRKPTWGEMLEALQAELDAALTKDAVDAILAGEKVQKMLDKAINGTRDRLNAMVKAALERTDPNEPPF